MKKLLIVLLALSVSIACAPLVKFAPTGKTYPPYTGPVQIYETIPENLNYVEIGWVTSEGDWNHAWGDLLKRLQQKAADNGANAILLVTSNYDRSDGVIVGYFGNVRRSGERSIIAKAIRVLDQ
jgi:hypothetical protein